MRLSRELLDGSRVPCAQANQRAIPDKVHSANASTSKIARNVLLSYASTAASMVSGLVVTPIVLHYLGTSDFGLWTLLGSIIAYCGLIELGVGTALVKRVAECHATSERVRIQQFLGSGFALYLGMAASVLIATCVLAMSIGHLFRIAARELTIARIALLLLGLEMAVRLVFNIRNCVLVGTGRMDLAARASLVIILVSGGMNILVVMAGYGIPGLACSLLVTTFATGYINWSLSSKWFPDITISLAFCNKRSIAELFRFGSRNSVVSLCAMMAYYSDTLIIGAFLPMSSVAYYAIASKLSKTILAFAGKPVDVLIPVYSHSAAVRDRSRLFRVLTESVMLTMGLAVPCVIVTCCFGAGIIKAWVGPGHDVSYPILIVLSVTLLFQLPGYACFALVTGTERNVFLVKMLCVSAPANFILSVVLTRAYGPIGVALGSLIAVVIADFVVLPVFVCRQFEFPYASYIVKGFGPLVMPTAVGLSVAISLHGISNGSFGTIASSVVVLVVFWFVLITKGLGPTRRMMYFHRLRGIASA